MHLECVDAHFAIHFAPRGGGPRHGVAVEARAPGCPKGEAAPGASIQAGRSKVRLDIGATLIRSLRRPGLPGRGAEGPPDAGPRVAARVSRRRPELRRRHHQRLAGSTAPADRLLAVVRPWLSRTTIIAAICTRRSGTSIMSREMRPHGQALETFFGLGQASRLCRRIRRWWRSSGSRQRISARPPARSIRACRACTEFRYAEMAKPPRSGT